MENTAHEAVERIPIESAEEVIGLFGLREENVSLFREELGVDIQTISALLGHESARTTLDFYGHSLTEQQIRAASLLASC